MAKQNNRGGGNTRSSKTDEESARPRGQAADRPAASRRRDELIRDAGGPGKSHPDLNGRPTPRRRGSDARRGQQRSATATGSRRRPRQESGLADTGSKIATILREHPVPLLMIGTGLTWLLLESRGMLRIESRLVEGGRRALGNMGEVLSSATETTRDAMSGVAGTVGRSVGSAAGSLAEGASTLGQYAQSGASSVADGVKEVASTIGDKTHGGFEHGRELGADLWERHPLATSAAILSAGIAAGMLLPGTRREGRLLGSAYQEMSEKIGSKAGAFLERGRELVASAADAIGAGQRGSADRSSKRRRGGGGGAPSKSRPARNRK